MPNPPSNSAADGVVANASGGTAAPLGPILAITFFGSLATGVVWHGLAFIADEVHGFSQTRNLTLYVLMGVVYLIFAGFGHSLLDRVAAGVSTRTRLALAFGIQGVVCLIPLVTDQEIGLWIIALIINAASALAWPIVESYLAAGRHGPRMQRAIGWFNIVWMTAVILPMVVVGPLMDQLGDQTITWLGLGFACALICMWRLPPTPGRHDESESESTGHYPFLLRASRCLLPISYLLNAAFNPLLPYRFSDIGVPVDVATPLAASWMIARVVVVVAMSKFGSWRGRWSAPIGAAVALFGGFALIMFSRSTIGIVTGLVIFGAAMGAIYYMGLYYAMVMGDADVDAGGTHEALIGVGYAAGPLASLGGKFVGALAFGGAATALASGVFTVAGGVAAIWTIPAIRAWRRARHAHRNHDGSDNF